jgi:hypothetical protein
MIALIILKVRRYRRCGVPIGEVDQEDKFRVKERISRTSENSAHKSILIPALCSETLLPVGRRCTCSSPSAHGPHRYTSFVASVLLIRSPPAIHILSAFPPLQTTFLTRPIFRVSRLLFCIACMYLQGPISSDLRRVLYPPRSPASAISLLTFLRQ